uniref:Alternative protein SPRYD3 n=1 Tax=Homo sapiens TaxID=9606 RepID=L8EBB5_HUMAN|nr:alternative protein SPRYD3 [Homo sapiens]
MLMMASCTMAEPRAASLGQSATPGTGLAVALSLCPLMCRPPRSSSPKMGSGWALPSCPCPQMDCSQQWACTPWVRRCGCTSTLSWAVRTTAS